MAFSDVDDEFSILAHSRVTEGRLRQVVGQIPAGGPAVKPGHLVRVVAVQRFV